MSRAALPATAISALHAHRAGITEDLLAPARSADGVNPYEWLTQPLPVAPRVLDLCCGSAPLADAIAGYTGVDSSAGELGEARRRRPGADLRLADALDASATADLSDLDAVTVSMALMLVPLEALLARVARVLGSGGLLTAIVPMRGGPVVGTPYGEVLAVLGELDRPYPEPLDDVAGRCAGFELLDDARESFVRMPDVELVLSSFYAPDASPAAREAARRLLTEPLDYPLRRLVLRRR